ncbi:MAG: dTDP-glucose 4,6-dehydratase [Verrucomicrobia bacterium CG_4_10_14_3_um_filter_43_23]|nr:MAG: hypothetical protein AUJ82_04785 [Verrucomicrobia bacterium CG1_02_43_26]PIP58991.1 MAG: dTDP-glucose 4,6-dehydratase [Verrucomicrobia bacterium CG22_combo_CG10-13_8_21_14_all_43_17]PIX59089.1 MAG: dTDP-glucose 4,6-dehydratase [Verrucomicrobia bacterium CG_4_10_14_3_um_filter_43_23]PIY61389.1 MAG: dTDP-glucose 4,6-dehydratase [Verrucomicrobia bacterium CG_4_10_14_0_8_um_filter_43_34]PJA44171.1 MAG: dTDP-glucose 4,6-dehydratase [Verrucomicrobia bacterium CG_4_9_14_3_um_filter_43_20]
MRKIVVIGSNSFSGQDFVDLLLEDKGNEVIGISRSPEISPLMGKYHRHGRDRFRFYRFDLNRDSDWVQNLLEAEKPEYIVNFAAQSEVAPSWDHPDHWYQTNGVGIVRLVNPLREAKWLKKYVHISSPEIYGNCEGVVTEASPMNPTTPYAASKAAGDLFLFTLVKNFGFPLTMIRATNVYGPRQQLFKIIPRTAIYQQLDKKVQLHGGGVAVKSFIHIRDVSKGEMMAMEQGDIGSIYHFSPDRGHSVREIVEKMCEISGKKFEEATEIVGERLGQDSAYVIDSTKARKQFGWKPEISIDTGLGEAIDWVSGNWNEIKEKNLTYTHKE